MKFFKYFLITAIIIIILMLGMGIYTKDGNIKVEMVNQQSSDSDYYSKEFKTKKVEYIVDKNGNNKGWYLHNGIYKRQLRNYQSNDWRSPVTTITAAEGYQLVAYDKEKNILGIVVFIEIDDGGQENNYEADFDLEQHLYKKSFTIEAKKIEK